MVGTGGGQLGYAQGKLLGRYAGQAQGRERKPGWDEPGLNWVSAHLAREN
jgi:hypothetical protein